MIQITKGELYVLRDALQSVVEDEDYDMEDVLDALDIVESLINKANEELEF